MKRVGWLALFSTAVAGVACADAIHLEPPPDPTGGTGASTSTGNGAGDAGGAGGAGGAPTTCESNTDCAAPQNICDTIKGECVECLVFGDCAQQPGTVCSMGACVCPTAGESWCGDNTCVDLQTDSDHCGSCDHGCFGACAEASCVDAWEPMSDDGAPAARFRHTAVWTGTEMIIWGGTSNGSTGLATGGIYNLAEDSWTAVSSVNAPTGRHRHTAVWTGTEMIVWGGEDGGAVLQGGASFDPATNSWAPVSDTTAPTARRHHTAVWTGTEMIVWGGDDGASVVSTGGIYDRSADAWSATPAVACARERHTAIWDGTRMVIYGGLDGATPPGPIPGTCADGGSTYTPSVGWTNLTTTGQPSGRYDHSAAFDGTAMLVWGGNNGSIDQITGHKLLQDAWSSFTGPAPAPRSHHTAVWVEDVGRMIVWGGEEVTGAALDTGAELETTSGVWLGATSVILAARRDHTAVATGDRMIVWGGRNASNAPFSTGGIYTPQ